MNPASEPTSETIRNEAVKPAPTKKPKKPQGPIRWGAIGPVVIVIALTWAYFFFFFDSHVRHALEFIGTQGNGAEVNVASVHSSFWSASLEIAGVQVTSATEPSKNKIQIGKMQWKMSWDALLRGKVVIDDASILEIALGAPRAKPGYVVPPPPPPPPASDKPSMFAKLKDEALGRAQEEFSKNVFGDAVSLLKGSDPAAALKGIEGELKSSARLKALQDELGKKQKEWQERLNKLPQQKELQALQDKLKTVKLDRFENPAQVQQSLQQLDAIFKEADAKIKEVQSTHQALNGDMSTYQNSLNDLQALVNQDIKDLENRLKLPKLDVESLSRTLFGPVVLSKLKQAEFYMGKARQYMPPKKSKDEKQAFVPTPHERAKGRNYQFGRPNSYPLFWLRKAQMSSKVVPGAEFSGDLVGTIEDVASDPSLIGRPAIASFKGEFPNQGLFGIDGKLTIDHTGETPVEKLDLSIGSFPITNRQLVDSADVKIGVEGAAGSTAVNAEFSGEALKITSASHFGRAKTSASASSPSGTATAAANTTDSTAAAPSATPSASFLKSESSQPLLAEILKSALADIPKVSVMASISGQWTDPKFNIDSNLGRDLAKAFEKQFQAKINEARAKLQNFVNEQTGKQKEQLNAEFNKHKSQIEGLLKQKTDEVNKSKSSIEQAKNDATKNQGKKVEEEGKKALEGLKKQFGF